MGIIVYIILVALCAASISYTISYTSIFLGFREWISKFHYKLEELIHCPYCLCHYIILTIMFTTNDIHRNKLRLNDLKPNTLYHLAVIVQEQNGLKGYDEVNFVTKEEVVNE